MYNIFLINISVTQLLIQKIKKENPHTYTLTNTHR